MSEAPEIIRGEAAIGAYLFGTMPEDSPLLMPPPLFTFLDMHLSELEPGVRLTCTLAARREFCNPAAVVQGGIIASAIDGVIGAFAYHEMGQPVTTTTLNINYLRPLYGDGSQWTAEARVRARTRKQVFLDGTACNAQGKPVALLTTTMRAMV